MTATPQQASTPTKLGERSSARAEVVVTAVASGKGQIVFGDSDEFMEGLAGLAGKSGLTRSMEAEFRTNEVGAWWAEYEYVVLRAPT